jgi:hypothetical protein
MDAGQVFSRAYSMSRILATASSTRRTAIGAIRFGNQRPGKAELGGLLETLLSAWCRADLARQTNFTKHNKFRWQCLVFQG